MVFSAMNKRPGYIAVILSDDSAERLKKLAKHKIIHCTHVTLAYEPSDEVYAEWEPHFEKKMDLLVKGIRTDDNGQAAVLDGVVGESRHPHITISCAPDVRPVYSKQMLEQQSGELTEASINLRGTICFVPFKN